MSAEPAPRHEPPRPFAVAAPVFALILLAQSISAWAVAGGSLILAAGALVVWKGGADAAEAPQ